MIQTAFQKNAFQNNAFQIEIILAPLFPGRVRKKPIPTIIVNGRIVEYEKKHLEELKAILLLSGRIKAIDRDHIEKIICSLKTKENIDIERLLIMLADE